MVADGFFPKLVISHKPFVAVVTAVVTRNYTREEGIMTGIPGVILEQLKRESLKKRRKDNRLILLYKCLKGKA